MQSKLTLVFVFSFLILLKGYSQTSEDSIKTVISNMFKGMKEADTSLLKSVFAPTAILQTIISDKSGNHQVRTENINDFIKFVGQQQKNDADEQIVFDVVKADGALAIAWTPYNFYYKGKFSHCGVNSFQLVKINGDWKIQYIIDTRRRNNCKQ